MKSSMTKKEALSNYCMGLSGEAGELIDHIKKHLYHGHEFNPEYASKEIGDVLWYVAAIASELNLNLDEVAIENIEKLMERYPQGFNCEDSIKRVDIK